MPAANGQLTQVVPPQLAAAWPEPVPRPMDQVAPPAAARSCASPVELAAVARLPGAQVVAAAVYGPGPVQVQAQVVRVL
jgi:hypothetical protein